MSRTHKKDYTGSKAIDSSCRSHGDCPACSGSRKHKYSAAEIAYQEYMAEAYCQCKAHTDVT